MISGDEEKKELNEGWERVMGPRKGHYCVFVALSVVNVDNGMAKLR